MKKPLMAFFCFLLVGCAKTEGTSTGNPLVAVQFQSYSSMDAGSLAAVTDLKMCFKRLRLKNELARETNVDLSLGEVTISTSGTLLTTATVPAGTYKRVEFDLYSGCASGKSLQITNANGTFSTSNSMKIRFDGTLVVTGPQDLNLNIQSIIDALKNVSADNEIVSQAQAAGGSF